jgi:hypothetical protein
MVFVPVHRAASLDVVRRPEWRAATVPAWTLWLLRGVVALPYFFGGVAKINGDWLRGDPMRLVLTGRANTPVVGPLFTEPLAPYLFSYGGMLFDLAVVPLLLWRRTRPLAVAMVIFFHLSNQWMFTIGIFPWFMLFATAIFFEPERLTPVLRFEKIFAEPVAATAALETPKRRQTLVMASLSLLVAFHVPAPLRHYLYPGDASWTEEGHVFSWRMMLRTKFGAMKLVATDPDTGETWTVDQSEYLTSKQISSMRGRPDMIVQFSRHLEDEYRKQGHRDLEVRADAKLSLNGRPPQHLIDPKVDLTEVTRRFAPAPWIVPHAPRE